MMGGSRQPEIFGRVRAQRRIGAWLALLFGLAGTMPSVAAPVEHAVESALAQGQALDVIVEFDHAAADREARAARQRRGLAHEDTAILAARGAHYAATKQSVQRSVAAGDAQRVRDYPHLPLSLWHLASPAALARLRGDPAVRAVFFNGHAFAVAAPADLAMIEQPAAATAGASGAGTTVAVIDTGIDLTNPAFLSNPASGNCTVLGQNGCRVIYDQIFYPGAANDVGHGTNVSGVVAEIAPAASLAMLNVFNGAGASFADIISAIDWAVANQAAHNIVSINMSLGDGGNYMAASCPATFAAATSGAVAAGITVVAASGNNANSQGAGVSLPACTPGTVSVGAVYDSAGAGASWGVPQICADNSTAVDQITCFTNIGSNLTLLAPGVFITAAGIQLSGTSQASPHVAGTVAALRARYPRESLAQTQARLTLTGTPDGRQINNTGPTYTIPRIDVLKAFDLGTSLAISGTGPTTAQAGTTASYTLTVTNNGPLEATAVTVTDTLPSLATFVSASPACSLSGASVACSVTSLAVNASTSFTITVRWTGTGPVYDTASVSADQIDATPAQQTVALGTAPPPPGDVPDYSGPALPPWAAALLAGGLLAAMRARRLPNR